MTRQDAIENLTLALMYLTRFEDGRAMPFDEIAWKHYDSEAMDALDEKGMIVDPHVRRGPSKYAYLTEKGRDRACALLSRMGIEEGGIRQRFELRTIRPEEAETAAEIERICFPPNEACSREHMLERVAVAPETFLVAIDRSAGRMAGFVNGIATDETVFRDEFFTDALLHKPDGRVVMIFGVDVLPEYRMQGLAREMIHSFCRRERERGRRMLVLTCLEDKVKMYAGMGFRDRGESGSSWGGERWHEMDILLN